MPFVTVLTNLSTNQLPAKFMPNFITALAKILNKSPDWFTWTLDAGKTMSSGADNERKPLMIVRIEESHAFESEAATSEMAPKIFAELVQQTGFEESTFQLVMLPLPLWRIGFHGKAIVMPKK